MDDKNMRDKSQKKTAKQDTTAQPEKISVSGTNDVEQKKTPDMQSAPDKPDETSFWNQAEAFFSNYKAEISLTVLILYVITLAVATIIELVQH